MSIPLTFDKFCEQQFLNDGFRRPTDWLKAEYQRYLTGQIKYKGL